MSNLQLDKKKIQQLSSFNTKFYLPSKACSVCTLHIEAFLNKETDNKNSFIT